MPDHTPAPAMALPQVQHAACPYCGAQPGQLCTSHGGTRPRRTDAHQDRTAAYRAQTKETPSA